MNSHFPLIVGNWKMHKNAAETKLFLRQLKPLVFRHRHGVWLAVSFTNLYPASQAAKDSHIQIGAQNMSDLLAGAMTGEVSAVMIKEAGAEFVILGHSERRRLFYEDNAMINRKVKLALRSGLSVILCIGETKEEREAGKTKEVLSRQLSLCMHGVGQEMSERLIIAYEPVWAIGSNFPATTEIVEEIHSLCKNYIANYWGLSPSQCRVLYGGSVNAGNAGQFLNLSVVDGLLVGAASLELQSFVEIIHQAEGVQ